MAVLGPRRALRPPPAYTSFATASYSHGARRERAAALLTIVAWHAACDRVLGTSRISQLGAPTSGLCQRVRTADPYAARPRLRGPSAGQATCRRRGRGTGTGLRCSPRALGDGCPRAGMERSLPPRRP